MPMSRRDTHLKNDECWRATVSTVSPLTTAMRARSHAMTPSTGRLRETDLSSGGSYPFLLLRPNSPPRFSFTGSPMSSASSRSSSSWRALSFFGISTLNWIT